MAIKYYSEKFIFWVLVITIASCSKYERTNPNDKLGPDGTPIIAIDGYEVIIDNNSDTKLQKNESATVKVLVKNTGTKVTQITSAVFTSNSSKLVIENFIPENIMSSYVGKTNSIGNLRIKVASNATVGEIFTCNVKLTDKTGTVHNTILNLKIDRDSKPSNFSFNSLVFEGLEEATDNLVVYAKGITPYIRMEIINNDSVKYDDSLTLTITSLDDLYPYLFSKKIKTSILSNDINNIKGTIDCLPQFMPDNYNLLLNVAITDKYDRLIERQVTVKMSKNTAKLDMISYEIWSGSTTPGSKIIIDCVVKNSGGRILPFAQGGAKISTTSPYLSNLNINVSGWAIDINETRNNLFGFVADIASNCPIGTKIPLTFELTTNELCPTKFTSTLELEIK